MNSSRECHVESQDWHVRTLAKASSQVFFGLWVQLLTTYVSNGQTEKAAAFWTFYGLIMNFYESL